MKNNRFGTVKRRLICISILLFVPFFTPTLRALTTYQQIIVSGSVTDNNGVPLAGVHIMSQNTKQGVISDYDGSYAIQVQPNDTLIFSAIGFITQTIAVNNQTKLQVKLQEDVTQLGTVVLNAGYYAVKDKERTGNIAKLEAKTIEKQPVNNPLAALQGHVSGVNIVQATGVPGGGYKIDIRGKNFINSSTDPLFIIDGVPFGSQSLDAADVSIDINGANSSPLNAINPADIESMEILKDADATAIYGSRAANGVVLITTKRGKQGKTRVTASTSSTFGQVTHFLDLMDTQQYLEVRREGVINDGFGAFLDNPVFDFVWPDLKTWDQNRYTDWQKELIGGTAFRNMMQVSVSGGSEQTQFLISGAHQKETTVFPGDSNYKKTSVHSSMNHQSKDQRFSMNWSVIYSLEDNNLPRTDLTNKAFTLEPNAPALYDASGQINWENNSFDNPLAALEETYQSKVNTLIANVGLSYKILPSLELKTSLGYTDYALSAYKLLPSTARNPSFGFTPENYSSITTNTANRQSWIVEPQIHWNSKWNDMQFNVLIGTTFQEQTAQQFVQRGTGFPNNNLLLNLSSAKTVEVREDSDSEYAYHAIFGRLNINWKDKYLLNVTGRRDGSSRFGSGRQFGNFGAVGVAWIFSEESLFKNGTVLSFGKLRGSYGTTGSDNIGDYRYLDTYSVTGYEYNGVTTLQPSGIYNPEFGWEVNKKLEAALELGFAKNRIVLNSSWYQNRSSNQLIGIPLAGTTGFNSLTGNFDATVQNTGLEFDVRTVQIQTTNFQWQTTINLSIPKNKLLAFPNLESSTFANRYIIGEPLTMVRLYHALGVDPDTGLYQFEDYNNDGDISSLDDRQWIADFAPKFYGGLGNNLKYKNISLDIFFQFKKQQGYNYLASGATVGYRRNGAAALYNRWKNTGDIAPIQRATFGQFPGVDAAGQRQSESNAAVSDASFIRLRNITLSYKVPETFSRGMDISVYLQGQNLWTITPFEGADPEQALSYILPPLRQITVGMQLGF